jgi:hypothetical protein
MQEVETVTALYSKLLAESAASELNQEVLKRTIITKVVDQTLLDLIIVRRLPLSIVEWPEFRQFCIALNQEVASFLPTSHNTITKRIKTYFPDAKDIVRKLLQSAKTSIHLAVDVWTSPNNHLLLAICGSFVDIHDRFQNILIGLRTTYGQSGAAQWVTLLPVLEEYGIVEKIGTVIGDNSGTNDVLCRTISSYLSLEKKQDWSPIQQRIRCQGHILNLVVQAFLFGTTEDEKTLESYDQLENDIQQEEKLDEKQKKEREAFVRSKLGVMGKLHNIIVHIRASANRTQAFIKIAKRTVPLDNRTRWNSWAAMLKVALSDTVKPALQEYIEQYFKEGLIDKRDVLTMEEWIQLRTITTFLEAFEGATLEMQGNQPTLGQVLENMDVLYDHFNECLVRRTIVPFFLY